MKKDLFENKLIYPEVVMWWSKNGEESEIRLRDRTLKEAYNIAVQFGYVPPVWYKPWQYFTGGIGVMTIGFGVQKDERL